MPGARAPSSGRRRRALMSERARSPNRRSRRACRQRAEPAARPRSRRAGAPKPRRPKPPAKPAAPPAAARAARPGRRRPTCRCRRSSTALQAGLPGAVEHVSFWVGDWTVIVPAARLAEACDVPARHARLPVRLPVGPDGGRLAGARREAVRRGATACTRPRLRQRVRVKARAGGRRGRAERDRACGRRPTGSSARCSTCSASRSPATRTCAAS